MELTSSLLDALVDLRWDVQTFPREVTDLVQTKSATPYSHWQAKLSLGWEASSTMLAKRIAALANGAIANGRTTAYLVFGLAESNYRERTADGTTIRRLDEIPRELIQLSLEETCRRHVDPPVFVAFTLPAQQTYAYLQIDVRTASPVYCHDRTEAGDTKWVLPVFQADVYWSVVEASESEREKLFEIFLNSVTRQFADSDHEALVASLRRQRPSSAHELAGYLASLLLRTKPDDRAVAARSLGLLGGLNETVRALIVPLVFSLIEDEQAVAICALESLLSLGRDIHVPRLIADLPRFSGSSRMTELAFQCIGELGSRDCVQQLLALAAQFDLHRTCGSHLDSALVRLYARHRIDLFDTTLRDALQRDLTHFRYKQAQELLQFHGSAVCVAPVHRRAICALVDHAALRRDDALAEALQVLQLAVESFTSDEPETDLTALIWMRADEFRKRVDELLETVSYDNPLETQRITSRLTAWRLAQLFFELDVCYIERDYKQFLALIYNYVEKCALFMVARTGVGLHHKESDPTDSGKSDTITISPGWIDTHLALLEGCASRKELSLRIDRSICKKVLRILASKQGGIQKTDVETAGTTAEVVKCRVDAEPQDVGNFLELADRLEKLIRIRHSVATGHGLEKTTEKRIADAYAAGGFADIIGDLRLLHQYATGEQLGENTYISLNHDIRWILQRADIIPPSFRLLYS